MIRGTAAALALTIVVILSGVPGGDAPRASAAPFTFHCSLDASCPEIAIAGDSPATLGGGPSPFRGYGDPSLEYDPTTGALWMTYSWLNVLVTNPGPSQLIDFGVETHLARSDDGGESFTVVEAVNQMTATTHPDTSATGWASHEVSTLVRQGVNDWQMLWLSYFDPSGPAPFFDPYYERALGSSPDSLAPPAAWARGYGTSPSWGAQHNLSAIPQLSDCVVFTEPALFRYDGITYLATNCTVFSGGMRQDAQERLVLLRQEASGYSYVGTLLDGADAVDAGGTRIEQADIALSRTGEILLIATPIQPATPNHLGCTVFEITDITTAQVMRDTNGQAVQLARITGDDDILGPGLCTYDAASETGIIMVLHVFNPSPFDMDFSMRATGVHPMDTDGDGVENMLDQDDDGDGIGDGMETGCGSDPLSPVSITPERIGGPFAGVDDDGDTQVDEALPTGSGPFDCDGDGYTGSAEASIFFPAVTGDQDACGTDAWPSDFVSGSIPDSTDRITLIDLTSFIAMPRPFGTSPGDASFTRRWDLLPGAGVYQQWINLQDFTALITTGSATGSPPMLGGARAFGGPTCPW